MNLKHVPVTYWILGVLLAVFVVQLVSEVTLPRMLVTSPIGQYSVNQVDWNFALWPGKVIEGQALWGVVTSMFLHADLFHIFFNGWALYLFGLYVERMVGSKNLLKIFFAAGIIGSFAHIAFSMAFPAYGMFGYALGASGGIFGILGALVILEPNIKVIMMPVPIPLPLWQAVTFFVIFMSLLFGFSGFSGIAHDVHMAGLAVGLIMGLWLKGKMKKDKDFTWKVVYKPVVNKDPYEWIDEYR